MKRIRKSFKWSSNAFHQWFFNKNKQPKDIEDYNAVRGRYSVCSNIAKDKKELNVDESA